MQQQRCREKPALARCGRGIRLRKYQERPFSGRFKLFPTKLDDERGDSSRRFFVGVFGAAPVGNRPRTVHKIARRSRLKLIFRGQPLMPIRER